MDKIFKAHKDLKECWKTSDGQYFRTLNAAQLHARSLKDQSIEKLVRKVEATPADDNAENVTTEVTKTGVFTFQQKVATATDSGNSEDQKEPTQEDSGNPADTTGATPTGSAQPEVETTTANPQEGAGDKKDGADSKPATTTKTPKPAAKSKTNSKTKNA